MPAIPASGGAALGQTEASALFVRVHGDNPIAQHRLLSRPLDHDSHVRVVTGPGVRLVVLLSWRKTIAEGTDRELQSGIRSAVGKSKGHIAAVLAFAAVAVGSADFEKKRFFNVSAGRCGGRGSSTRSDGRR